ncbi:centrosomal protein of 192 kDa isoform X1 [Paramormyrops kingsleyae]|uniref:centrosomal protein of 192 kDa isoform X1 n=1 Tax=Paramormyrops kingsleyae TaxID=1676925 RepID=UPI003B9786CB
MTESFRNIEDEPFPSFLSASLSSTGRATLGNVTLGSTLGVPMAASTVAKIRAATDSRVSDFQASYLEGGQLSHANSQSSKDGKAKFALSINDDLDNVDDFIAAHRFSDMLVSIHLDESESAAKRNPSVPGPPAQSGPAPRGPVDHGDDISTGLITLSHLGGKDDMTLKATPALPTMLEEDGATSDGADSDRFSGSVSSFLANEKLMSLDSLNSDDTDEDVDPLQEDELELYFSKLVPPGMQRGRVEGQEIPAAVDFQMPHVRLAATGMDSCPASDEDTEDELEAARRPGASRTRHMFHSSSRQLVGESNRPSFRPGLEGGSSDDDLPATRQGPGSSGIEFRRSAEGQVINSPVAGDGGGGGDGSSGGEGQGSDGGVSVVPLTSGGAQAAYDVTRGLGIVGASGTGGDDDDGFSWPGALAHSEMGDRVGPVGTGEAGSADTGPGGYRVSPVNWSMTLDRQVALDAMDSTESAIAADGILDSLYWRSAAGQGRPQEASISSLLQGTQGSIHLSQVHPPHSADEEVEADAPGPRGGPCGNSALPEPSDSEGEICAASLEAKYFSRSFQEEDSDSRDRSPDNAGLDFQPEANDAHGVVYQNEEGKWVTDLAYYSTFAKEMGSNVPELMDEQLEGEQFVSGTNAIDKIIEDQEEFEREHQFMQEEQVVAPDPSLGLGDTSWKLPDSNHVLLRVSQVSSDFEKGSQSYLRLSLGEFFQQRSEALGCLGDSEEDIKRPSFGYVITSPEKREPFALIRSSDFSSRGGSAHSDADKTMTPEDLDKTLEEGEGEGKNGQAHPGDVGKTFEVPPSPAAGSQSAPTVSPDSLHSNSNLALSISTIASAIADASVSSDPAQLAAMIMELSKRSKAKVRQEGGGAEASPDTPMSLQGDRSGLAGTPQMSMYAGELSALDMEKYLRKAEVSGSDGDLSVSPYSFDILSCLGDSLRRSTPLQREELATSTPPEGQAQVWPSGCDTPSGGISAGAKRSSIPIAKALASRQVPEPSPPAQIVPAISEAPGKPGSHTTNGNGGVRMGTVRPRVSSMEIAPSAAPSPGQQGAYSGPPSNRDATSSSQKQRSISREVDRTSSVTRNTAGKNPGPQPGTTEKHVCFAGEATMSSSEGEGQGFPRDLPAAAVEETQCTFRPSTSPLTHSSPSQTSIPSTSRAPSSPASVGGLTGKRSQEPLSPESVCSSPSLSRLTYVSMSDSTCLPTPEKHKVRGNGSLALSTTIVRASPTPPVEPDLTQNLYNHLKGPTRNQDCCLREKSPDPGTRRQSECDFRGLVPDGGKHKRHSEPSQRKAAPGDSGYSSNINIQQPGTSDQASQQWPREMYPRAAFGTDDLRYVPIAGFKPQGSLLDLPPAVPALHSGQPLFSPQLNQQYLGVELPVQAYHMGGASGLYGPPSANPTMGHIPGSIPLSASGLPGSYLHPGPIHQPPLVSGLGKPYGQHDLEALSMWAAEQVIVPEELKFPTACCVGIASQTTMSMFNPTERWVQVGISVSGLSIDGEKVDVLPIQWLIVKSKTIIGPKSTEEQKVLFIPPQAGVYKCVISVSSWPASAAVAAGTRVEVFARRVVLVAVAENPSIEVDVGPSGCLAFGDLVGGSAKALPLKLVNRTRATVPVRLVISANANAWRCFTFSKSSVTAPADGPLNAGGLPPLAAPSVMNHVMHAGYGDNLESFMLWVQFHAPQRYTPCSGELGPAEEYVARVDIELDGPGPSQVIKSIPLRARAGIARVHAPKDMQNVYLAAPLGKTSRQILPLKNAGNIEVQLKLKSTDADGCFSVKPEDLVLREGEEQGVTVSFHAQGDGKFRETMLTILVLPSGPQYEVMLKGEVTPEDSGKRQSPVKVPPVGVVKSSEVPPILSNKQFMAWGGVTLGRAVQQKLVLRNNSPGSTQQLRLLIRGQDQDCFQLQSTFGPEERLSRHREVTMRPREDVAVHLLFAPTRVACMLAKLEIKQSGVCSSQPGVKFTIPLSGYGGTSNIILEEARKLSDSYVVTMAGVSVGGVSKVCMSVRNTGSRAAFIKAAAYADLQTRKRMDASVISLSPPQFVLKERTQEVVTILLKATSREHSLCQSATALLATVCFFCGDEVSRQQYRRLLCSRPDAGRKLLSDSGLLKDLSFDEPFLGEEQVLEVYDLPQRPNEAQLFYSNMSKVVLTVLGTVDVSDSGESDCVESLRPSPRHGSESDSGFGNSDRHISNVSLDVLPVKGPQGPPLSLSVADSALNQPAEPRVSWSVLPEQLVLTVPNIKGAADTRHVRIQNHSPRELRFELSWPAHCLTVTPQHGTVEPKSHLQILISPNLSLAPKSAMLPWTGQIYVQCGDQQKFIKVQIRQDLALDVSADVSSPKPLSALPPQAETPAVSGGRSPESPLCSQVVIKSRTLVFPATPSGGASESFLEMENTGDEVRWYLSSFAPPYVKGVDNSGDVYRATYTTFRCSRLSGVLGVREKMKVPVSFLPRDAGDYAQFWDLECHPVAEPLKKCRVRFQLCGTGVKAGATVSANADSLVRTEATVKSRKKPESQEEMQRRGVYAPQDLYTFPQTRVGESCTLKVHVRNNSFDTHELKFVSPREPFHIKHCKYSLRSQHYINLPVQFRPTTAGRSSGLLLIQTESSGILTIQLTGDAVP